MAWEYKTTVRLYHTDAAGVVFYADLFLLAHDCFEDWLGQYVSLSELIDGDVVSPVIHTEADYYMPIRLSDPIFIEMTLAQIKTSSFTLRYIFKNADNKEAAQVQTTHVTINSQTRQAIEIPAFLQNALSEL